MFLSVFFRFFGNILAIFTHRTMKFQQNEYFLYDRRYASAMKPLLLFILLLLLAKVCSFTHFTLHDDLLLKHIGEPFDHTGPHQTDCCWRQELPIWGERCALLSSSGSLEQLPPPPLPLTS